MVLHGGLVTLRTGTPEDAPRLAEILREPEVQVRWGRMSEGDVRKEYVGQDHAFCIVVDGEVIGSIQYDEEDEPMYRHASVDLFLTAAHHRRGYGSDALRTLLRHLFDERGHHRVTIDPAADNGAAIATYERVGFKPVGLMRKYERGLDGTWHDSLLMDLLKDELRED